MNNFQLLLQSGILQLLVMGVALIAIVALFLKSKINENSHKLHLLYVSGILVFVIIELVSYICIGNGANSDSIVSYVSFASTLSSLILSVVAIIYTIVSNQKGNDVFIKISDRAEAINNVSDRLCIIVDNLDNKLNKFETELHVIHNITNDTNDAIKGISNVAANNGLSDGSLSIDDVLSQLIQTGSVLGNAALLACCYSSRKHKGLDLKVLFENNEEYVYGYLIAVSCLSFISIEVKDNIVTVSDVYDKLEEQLKQFFAKADPYNVDFLKLLQYHYDINDEFWEPADNS